MESERQIPGELRDVIAALFLHSDSYVAQAQEVEGFERRRQERLAGIRRMAFMGAERHSVACGQAVELLGRKPDGLLLLVHFSDGQSLQSADVGHHVVALALGQQSELREYVARLECVEIVAAHDEVFRIVVGREVAHRKPGIVGGIARGSFARAARSLHQIEAPVILADHEEAPFEVDKVLRLDLRCGIFGLECCRAADFACGVDHISDPYSARIADEIVDIWGDTELSHAVFIEIFVGSERDRSIFGDPGFIGLICVVADVEHLHCVSHRQFGPLGFGIETELYRILGRQRAKPDELECLGCPV